MILERQAPLCDSTWAAFDYAEDPIEVPTAWLPKISACWDPLEDTRGFFRLGTLPIDQVQPRARQLALDAVALKAGLGW